MTCKQARQLLAAYRREDLSPGENAELQAHLQECAACQAQAAEFRSIGAALQSLPKLAPPPDFYARVMAAVQAEAQPTAERAPATASKKAEQVVIPGLTDIAYLPSVRRAVTERRAKVTPLRRQVSPAGMFALRYGAGLAALFLIFAVGVSTGLFFLLRPGPTTGTGVCVSLCPHSLYETYSPDPAYPLVADATASADGQYIIYAAHNTSNKWMLEEFNIQTQKSTALLPAPVAGPLLLEGWAQSWVLWAQGNPSLAEHWELDATQFSPALSGAASRLTLLRGDQAGPGGTVKALHGISTLGATVFLAEELADGHGQLVSLDLTHQAEATRSVIATAEAPDHLIATPTATIDATTGVLTVYWVDQWQDADGTLHGNIQRLTPGVSPVVETVTTNGVSFDPLIVQGKLIWLEEQPAQPSAPTASQPAPTLTPTPTATPDGIHATQSRITGTLWVEPLDGRPDLDTAPKNTAPKTAISGTDELISDPQAGATFVVWKDKNGDYHLYDVPNNHAQALNDSITNPLVVSVSPNAILWVTSETPSGHQANVAKTSMNLLVWPQN